MQHDLEDDQENSVDDLLEEGRSTIFPTRWNHLPEDNDPPASPAAAAPDALPTDHPTTDTDQDSNELYQEGQQGS